MRFIPLALLLLSTACPSRSSSEVTLAQEYRSLRETIGRREFAGAITRCKQLIEHYPHHLPLYETLGEVHQYAARLPEGIAYLEDRIIDGTGISLSYFGLGNIYYLMQEDRTAIQCFSRAIELGLDHPDCYKLLEYAYERLEGVDNTIKAFTILSHRYPENANYWYALAMAYWGKGDYASCRLHLEQAISRRGQEARFQQALAALNLSTRGLLADEGILKVQLAAAEENGDKSAVHYLRSVLVQELVGRKEVRGAKMLCQRSLSEAERLGDFRWMAWVSLKMADICFFSGDLDSAKLYAREAILAGMLSGTPEAVRDAMERMTEACLETCDFLGALHMIEQRLLQAHIRESERDRARIALDLSRALLELGYPSIAIEVGATALSLAQAANSDSLLLCQIHTSIGLAFLDLGRYEEADRNIVLADLYNPFDGYHDQAASVTYGNLGLLSLDQQRLQEAQRNFTAQFKLAVCRGFIREEGAAYANLARTLELKGQIDSARAHYLRGHQIGMAIQNATLVALCTKGLARISRRSNDIATALRWHLASVGAADSMVILGEHARSYPDYPALIGLLADSKRILEALLVAERGNAYAHRSSVLAALAQQWAATAFLGRANENLGIEPRFVDSPGIGSGTFDDLSLEDQSADQRGRLSAFKNELVEARGSMSASLRYPITAESSARFLSDLQSMIPDSTLVIEFARSGNQYVMFVISQDSLEFVETALTQSQMEELIRRCSKIFVSDLADQRVWNAALAQFDRRALFELYSSTLSLARKRRPDAKRLIIVPDGLLRKVPFESLVCKYEGEAADIDFSHGRFLIEECGVTYLPTAATLVRDRGRAHAEKLLLAVGGITTNVSLSRVDPLVERTMHSVGATNLNALPGSLNEIEGLGRIVQLQTTLIEAKGATKARLLEEGPRHRIIHLAAHVRKDVRAPWRSGFVASSGGASEAGEITVFDLIEMGVRSDLVVLSGCSSNSTAEDAAPGGFGAALLASGVPSVISTLWDIDDATTSEMMMAFYAYLINGVDTDEALRQAKLDLIRSGRSDPYYWAGFILNGSPGNLGLETAGDEQSFVFSMKGMSAGVGVLFILIFLARISPGSSLLRIGWPTRREVGKIRSFRGSV